MSEEKQAGTWQGLEDVDWSKVPAEVRGTICGELVRTFGDKTPKLPRSPGQIQKSLDSISAKYNTAFEFMEQMAKDYEKEGWFVDVDYDSATSSERIKVTRSQTFATRGEAMQFIAKELKKR